ncbi:hypothetical protein GKO32_06915 [Amycolatopsis sp. RM579]|uniref:HTH-type transcriptional regulator EthR C-terminal domain-containing protein n=1 Tax=Amycolatopsis pithecellobii TaxID=664692 RepID=A0A6N7YLB5_9PSEU|nr:hypothetical protein [Amycolatopsis pithecellobii]MTD53715.1 hypothetical protein [Amycolatopsis pithecellobii]
MPEVAEKWQEIMSGLVDATAAAIDRERDRGAAPDGPAARQLAQTLNDVGTSVWMRSIYLADDPAPR